MSDMSITVIYHSMSPTVLYLVIHFLYVWMCEISELWSFRPLFETKLLKSMVHQKPLQLNILQKIHIIIRWKIWKFKFEISQSHFGPFHVKNGNTDPSKCINDQTLRSDREFCRTSHRQMSDQIVRQMSDQILPGRSESLHSQIVKL